MTPKKREEESPTIKLLTQSDKPSPRQEVEEKAKIDIFAKPTVMAAETIVVA